MTRMHTDIVSVKIRLIRVIRVPVFAALLCALGVLCGSTHLFITLKIPGAIMFPRTLFYCLLPSAMIVLPSTASSYVNSGERSPMKGALLDYVQYSPGFHVRGKVGFQQKEGVGKASTKGGRNNMYLIKPQI